VFWISFLAPSKFSPVLRNGKVKIDNMKLPRTAKHIVSCFHNETFQCGKFHKAKCETAFTTVIKNQLIYYTYPKLCKLHFPLCFKILHIQGYS
jgi:hypothetical protein